MNILKKLILFFIMTFFITSLYAGTAGKLAGVVRDKSTGEPLVGVNVIIEGTVMGTATDEDGYFVLLNVPAGTYNVVFSYVGYADLKMENIRIVPDITKQLNVDLNATLLQGEVIVVVAEKPFFEKGATNTVRVLDASEIELKPIKGVSQIIAVNAGVVMADGSGGETGNANINVRGGRSNETLIIVDGIPINDVLTGTPQGTLPDIAIEQISSQLGGFSAKYGNAQSGVINVVTKSGATHYFGGGEFTTSKLTDPFNYNMVNGFLGGPLYPNNKTLSFFVSGEYITTDNEYPSAIGINIPSIDYKDDVLPNAGSEVFRFTSKFDAVFDKFKITASTNGSFQEKNDYIHDYAKYNADHNPLVKRNMIGTSLRFSHFISENTFYDVTLRAKQNTYEKGDGIFFDNVEAYGDTLAINDYYGEHLLDYQGSSVPVEPTTGIFFMEGHTYPFYSKYKIETGGIDLNFTTQWKKHLIEFGGSVEANRVRYYSVYARLLAIDMRGDDAKPLYDRYYYAKPYYYGYDIMGNEINSTSWINYQENESTSNLYQDVAPHLPIMASFYIQDKIEFDDFILNAGIRFDYFDPDNDRLKDPENIFAYGAHANMLDPEDFEKAPAEMYLSPRLGFAFPVTSKTVFHAQYGIFRQPPRLFDVYDSWFNIEGLESEDQYSMNNGHLESESTVQYEFGFKHQMGNVASLDITAFYKNVKGLANIIKQVYYQGGTEKSYFTTANTDFGTIKGLAFGFNMRKIGPLSAKIDYTLSMAEGTGSSQSSNFTAAFRGEGEIPKSIAPLDFDQRHTLTASIDLRNGPKEGPMIGGIRPLENAGANFLISLNSGRPYTPIEFQNLLDPSNQGNLTQYINSAYTDGIFRIDMRLDKSFKLMDKYEFTAYVWVQNLLDRDNYNSVWRSTGAPDNSAFLETELGEAWIESMGQYGEEFILDYQAYEQNPGNYGIPRLIRLGLKFKF